MDFDGLVDVLLAEFDTDSATAARIANGRQRRLISRAKWRIGYVSLGNTTVGDATYALPGNLIRVDDLVVGGKPYARTTDAGIRALNRDEISLNGQNGAYALYGESGTSDYAKQVELYPTPSAIITLAAFGAVGSTTLLYGSSDPLLVPEEVEDYLLAGCRADCYRQVDDRPDMAAPEEPIFEQGVAELRRIRRELAGAPARLPVFGYDFQ